MPKTLPGTHTTLPTCSCGQEQEDERLYCLTPAPTKSNQQDPRDGTILIPYTPAS